MLTIKIFFSCYLIGEDHLLIQCAEMIIKNGHKILGIISSLEAAKNLALSHKINYFEKLDMATAALATTEFDYLFSIINSYILPVEVLNRAKKLAINFHNAPLPRYAGAHALSWAILNNEPYHGVTWHVMTNIIDGGELLKQAFFPIAPYETALSLSLKCYEHALSLFKDLLTDIENQFLIKTPQDYTLRSYYDFNHKPSGNGWIDWGNTSDSIERIVRALDLGHYHHNRLTSPKIQLGNTVFIICKLIVLNKSSMAPPGTLIELLPNAWHISTLSNIVSLEQLATLDGKLCQLDSLVKDYHLYSGFKIKSPTIHQLAGYKKTSEHCAKWEPFWIRRLTNFREINIPFQPISLPQNTDDSFIPVAHILLDNIEVSKWKEYVPPGVKRADIILTSIFIYLYRLSNIEELGAWIYTPKVQNLAPEMTRFFSSLLPFSLSLKSSQSFYEAIGSVYDTRTLIENKFTFQRDIFYRYPELTGVEYKHNIAFVIGKKNKLTSQLTLITATVVITISSDTNEITWWLKKSVCTQETKLLKVIKSSTNHLNLLLKSLPSAIHQPISRLPLLGKKEKIKIVHKWNMTISPYPRDKTISQVFEEQVIFTPDNIALICGKKSLSYSALNQQANQLAHYLQKKTLTPNSFAAICTTQELHLIIGILAILKTGAAYIPIDASYPKQHIKFLLEDSKPNVLLASYKLNEWIEHDCSTLDIPIIIFGSVVELLEQEPITNLEHIQITAKNLAYIIYTSGTTGKPKGVMVPHQGINRLVKNTNYIQISGQDRIAQAASISFDAATFEIWGALLNGATLIAVPHATLLDVSKFATFLKKNSITILWLTSALFNHCAAQDPSMFKYLKYLLVGGDVLNKERILSVLECSPGTPGTILNGYGPTENTTFTTTYHITKKDIKPGTIPIGKPIANSFVYILDDQLCPCPVGAIGELYTGGDGLALGYLNQPDLNQRKFINNPFSNDKKSKLYKTGDIVRWRPDGNIEYIGRKDNQVKIRGFRVELEAIQAHLLHHNAISQCSVQAKESDKHGKLLVAYIVCDKKVRDSELQSFLSQQLPIYMIPTFFVRLDKMPLTTNGKVNYKNLPKPDFGKSASIKKEHAPTTVREKSLVLLWRQLLGCENIGINDSFFDLGGHSLLITQLILQIKDNYKTDFPLHKFLENPTISHLNQLIESKSYAEANLSYSKEMHTDRFLRLKIQLKGIYHSNFPPKKILLTGVSGFLGAHLLYELYHKSEAKIYCLIRADDIQKAVDRINFTFKKYQMSLQCNDRIIPLLGDLARPLLGLSESQYYELTQEIDIIIHNGAAVNHLYNYELLRAVNVLSTIEIIHLSMRGKIKPIHYISTLSAASHTLDDSNFIIENFIDPRLPSIPPSDGYSQTKWVSEQLLTRATQQGLIINIYRPGWIVGHSHTGVINAEKNHLFMLIKGCIQLKVAPNWNMELDMLPVDTISSVITYSALNNHKNNVYNLSNPNKINWVDLIQYINNKGYLLSLIDPDIWKEKYLKFIDQKNALYSLYPLYINSQQNDWMKGLDNIARANASNTSNAFHQAGILLPAINKKLLDTYFNYLKKQGFIGDVHSRSKTEACCPC